MRVGILPSARFGAALVTESQVECQTVDRQVLLFDTETLLKHDLDDRRAVNQCDRHRPAPHRVVFGFRCKSCRCEEIPHRVLALNVTAELANLRPTDITSGSALALEGDVEVVKTNFESAMP